MTRPFAAFALLLFVPALGLAQDKKDPTADLLAKLRKPVDLPAGSTVKLTELVEVLTERHGVPTIVNNTAFSTQIGEAPADSEIAMPKVKGLPLASVLRQVLSEKGATYLVRRAHIEIVPIGVAAREAKISGNDDAGNVQLSQPLVSAIYKEKPLNEALADLAEEHDLTIVIAPQAADNKAGFVTARLLNVPADRAIELLALQADLRIVKKGASFFVTSKEHANEMFNEQHERKQKNLELELMRNRPFPFGGNPLGGPAQPPQPGK